MEKTRRGLLIAVAVVLPLFLSAPRPAFAASHTWDCTQLTSGGGGTWACYDGSSMWYVDCSSRHCVYQQM